MRCELRRATQGGRPPLRRRPLSRIAWAFPTVLWLTSSACQTNDAGNVEPGAAGQAGDAAATGVQVDADPEVMEQQMAMVTELQAIDQVLSPLQERALQDPEIQAEQGLLVAQVEAAMESISPGILDKQTRFDSLRADYGAAQQAGDQARLQSLSGELQVLQVALQQTQSQAIVRADVASSLTAFRAKMFDRMREMDPSADSLLTRAQDLSEALESMAAAREAARASGG